MKIFLDLDNTVTASRAEIDMRMYDVLAHVRDKVVISGASEEQIKKQLRGLPCIILSQNGNVNPLWQRLLTSEEREKILAHIRLYGDPNLYDAMEDRGAQISYSMTGHHADHSVKRAYDPGGVKRREILAKYPAPEGIEIKIGGTSCLDYIPAGLNKGANIKEFIRRKGWKLRDCIYVGDALFEGGNDETVIGVIATFPVKGWEDTLKYLTT